MKITYDNPGKCAVTALMEIIGGKWKPIILYTLLSRPKRFGQIKAYIPSISKKVLAEQLRELEGNKLLVRTVYPQVPLKVEYALSGLGESLRPLVLQMEEWALAQQLA